MFLLVDKLDLECIKTFENLDKNPKFPETFPNKTFRILWIFSAIPFQHMSIVERGLLKKYERKFRL